MKKAEIREQDHTSQLSYQLHSQRYLDSGLEDDLNGVLRHLRASTGRFGLASSIARRIADTRPISSAGVYTAAPRSSYLSSSIGATGYRSNAYSNSATAEYVPRATNTHRGMESFQKQQQLLRDHSAWLRDFRSRIGLERSSATLASSVFNK
jgi:hypothetical protein